ncbi:MAG: ATP synthase F1 subunit delta [Flavobacteriales bacterium]|uniref:ATP synthase F1 subunit delta n=1 Tax=Candidatus Ulvibacter alkanivorans TaxID=2267620 RepID=UPI000DF3E559|nr:ATP synthase F1 subunit delta [Candidatus Ulvibacter alkanivorans]MCH2489930.1 ATP synthase F1 subunit delta [Flavobacteriales bacterium]
MNGSKVAIRYAKAVLQQANDADLANVVFGDMQSVDATLEESKDLRTVLNSPVIKNSDKQEALLKIFSAQTENTKTLIKVLVENKRIEALGDVAKSYIHLYNEQQGVKVAKVTTALPITSEIEAQVLSKVKELTGSDSVTLENVIDEEIIGGFILRVGDLQYNASIANKLGNLKREFSKSL